MSSKESVISVNSISKCYQIYNKPQDRLKQTIASRFYRFTFQAPKNYFREFWALKNISFEVGKGEVVGIIGKNGSGKSTLLQVICGILNPNAGSCEIKGSVAALLELGSGFNPEFTGMENIYLYGQILGLSEEKINAILPDILDFADIGEFVHQPVKTYSSGMVVRLAFAVSVAREPDIFIVDEALAVGDEAFSRKCFARIEAIRKKGTTILFVSHGASIVVELCDRAIVLDEGELIYDGLPKAAVGLYTKLLFAPRSKRQFIRQQIIEGRSLDASDKLELDRYEEEQEQANTLRAFFAEGLVSQSRLEYESLGALIEDPHIRTLDGKRVNVLVPSESYQYCYTVKFQKRAKNVRFGMLIKTVSGYELGGAIYPNNNKFMELIEEDEKFRICFDFRCFLNEGTYFFNAGVQGAISEESNMVYLHRIIDAVMFKVLPEERSFGTAIINFDINTVVNKIGAS